MAQDANYCHLDGQELIEVLSQIPLSWLGRFPELPEPERLRVVALLRQLAPLVIEVAHAMGQEDEVRRRVNAVLEWRERVRLKEDFEHGLGNEAEGSLRQQRHLAQFAERLAAFRQATDPLANGARYTSITALAAAFERQQAAEWDEFRDHDRVWAVDRERWSWARRGGVYDWYDRDHRDVPL